MKKQDS